MPIERKLAAIMFTDIAGYTAQMSKDESVAISLLNKKESVLKPLIKKHNGTYVKSTGDGSLALPPQTFAQSGGISIVQLLLLSSIGVKSQTPSKPDV